MVAVADTHEQLVAVVVADDAAAAVDRAGSILDMLGNSSQGTRYVSKQAQAAAVEVELELE